MRIYIFSTQSSGSSLFTYWLGQNKDLLAILDVWQRGNALLSEHAKIYDGNMVMKGTVCARPHHYEEQRERFAPDKSVWYVRDPFQTYESLIDKPYGRDIYMKFKKTEYVFLNYLDQFDLVVKHEDFVEQRQATVDALKTCGIPADMSYYDFSQSVLDVVNRCEEKSPYLAKTFQNKWGTGNIQESSLHPLELKTYPVPESTVELVTEWCPTWVKFFEEQ